MKIVFISIDSITQEQIVDEVSSVEQDELVREISYGLMDTPDTIEVLHYFKHESGDSAVISAKYGSMLICGVASAQ